MVDSTKDPRGIFGLVDEIFADIEKGFGNSEELLYGDFLKIKEKWYKQFPDLDD